ncbi:MAG: hypothetical protein Q9191_000392 [Dirinaria sp. TL-2023a]
MLLPASYLKRWAVQPLATARWRRMLHLAPPFLLDSYIPRYHQLSSVEASKKRSAAYAHLRNCNLCPRLCGVNRYETTGVCLVGAETAKNHDIAHQRNGFDVTPEELAEWYLKLQNVGSVHNINLITPEHVVPQAVLSILHARELGLRLPIIYNTSAFDSLESLDLLDGLIDIYLPDFKVWNASTSKRLLKAEDYAATARESIQKMYAQVGDLCFTPDGIAKKGLLVRHLVMPGKEAEGHQIMKWLGNNLSRDTFINIMEQYHADAHVGKPRRVSRRLSTVGHNALKVDEPSGEVSSAPVPSERRYEDINKAVTQEEVSSIRKAAEDAGLWRFSDPVGHGGFNI